MKSLRNLALCLVGILALSLFALIGCQKPTPPPVDAGPTITLSEPTEAQPKLHTVKTYVGSEQMDAELCITPRQIQTGMMFRKTMGTNDGMLFNLSVPQQAGFWMNNCYVPLSVAYISPDGVIEEIHPLQVMDTNTVFSTANNIQFALETPQGWFDQHHVTTGMVIRTERGTLSETFQKQ